MALQHLFLRRLNIKDALQWTTKLFSNQYYPNDNTKKTSLYNIVSFILIPVALSVIVAFSLPYDELSDASDTIITVFSIVATLLLSFLALLADKSTTNPTEKELVKNFCNDNRRYNLFDFCCYLVCHSVFY